MSNWWSLHVLHHSCIKRRQPSWDKAMAPQSTSNSSRIQRSRKPVSVKMLRKSGRMTCSPTIASQLTRARWYICLPSPANRHKSQHRLIDRASHSEVTKRARFTSHSSNKPLRIAKVCSMSQTMQIPKTSISRSRLSCKRRHIVIRRNRRTCSQETPPTANLVAYSAQTHANPSASRTSNRAFLRTISQTYSLSRANWSPKAYSWTRCTRQRPRKIRFSPTCKWRTQAQPQAPQRTL